MSTILFKSATKLFTESLVSKDTFLFLPAIFIACFPDLSFALTDTPSTQVSSAKDFANMSLEDLANIEVMSVSRQNERLKDAPAAVFVITNEDIRRSGATSIPEALRLAPNLTVTQKNSHDWAITARGFNTELGNKLLVMIDGRTVYTPLFAGVFWDRQDYLLEDIERIEVISGPGGTLWGANAVNGVINIITKSSKDSQGLYIETATGNQLKNATAVRYGGKLAENITYRMYGKYFDRDNESLKSGRSATDSWNFGQGGFRIDAEATLKDSLTLQGDFYGANETDTITGENGDAKGLNVLGRWKRAISDDSSMKLQFYYDRTSFGLPKAAAIAPIIGPAGVLKDKLDTYDLDFQHNFSLGQINKFVWGLGYRYTKSVVDNAPNVGVIPEKFDQSLYSGFIQDEIKLSEKLSWTIGTKIEHNAFTGWEFEPSTRIQWKPSSNHMIWAAISRAVRTPSRLDRHLRSPTNLPQPLPQSVLNGNDNYVSENVIAYELGYRAQWGARVTTSISTFYNQYDDVRSVSLSPPDIFLLRFPLFFENNVKGETYGIEANGNWQVLDWWRLYFGYSILEENLRVKSGEVDFTNAKNEIGDPKHQVSIRSSMELPRNFQLDTQLRRIDSFTLNNGPTLGTVPSYTEMSMRLGWRVNQQLELSITAQNMLHDRHPEYGFPSVDRVEIERSIYGKVQLRF
ncbi:MAG TPA: TonB-dependent receptor [Methylophilaceae bacterium]|nr:TonB-dependent receptor [Methylophilaceae bacterium]